MAHLAGNPEAQQPGHNRLGRLFSSLVDGDTLPDVFSLFAEKNEGLIDSSLTPKRSNLDIENLSRELVLSAEPLRILKAFVADVTHDTHHHVVPTHTNFDTVSSTGPSDYKLYLAERLRDAGIEHINMPYHADSATTTHERYSGIRIVRLRTNGLFYIRTQKSACPYQEHLQLLEIESILNTALLANHYFLDANMASREDLLLFEKTYAQSIAAQTPAIVSRPHDKAQDGEWVVRKAISLNIESLRLPYRLELDFRTHVHTGRAAFRIKLPSPKVFPKVQYHAETGFTHTTDNSRKKAATDYNTRLGILVASCAFASSQTICEVWIEGVTEDPVKHCCLYALHLTREQFESVKLTDAFDPTALLVSWGASIECDEGILHPIKPTFSLEDERFCPPSRYDAIEHSTRSLTAHEARALGTSQVSGLSIDEGEHREIVATQIMRNLSSSTEKNVRMILSLTAHDTDASVRSAGERVVAHLIDGTLSECDVEAVGEEFVSGGALQAAVTQARALIAKKEFTNAESCILSALNSIDTERTYADNDTVCWRTFTSYVDRVLYNRLLCTPRRTTKLVPTAYFDAHLLASVSELLQKKTEQAIMHARRAVEIAPFNTSAHLHLAHCLEASNQLEEAIETLTTLLLRAHDPEGIGLGYYRMAFFQWRLQRYTTARACYQYALRFIPGARFLIGTEMSILALQEPKFSFTELNDEEIDKALASAHIPKAPTPEVSEIFLEGTQASLDAELFSVAKNFMTNLGIITKDDIYYDMLRSIEGEPDR